MDYSALIREAWAATWRHRFLWILALFAGGAAGCPGGGGRVQWPGDRGELDRAAPEVGQTVDTAMRWVAANLGLILAAAAALVALALVLLMVSLIAQGGMAQATVDLAAGRPSSLGRAWRAGLRLFWRYAGLWLLLVAAVVVIAAVAAAAVAFAAGSGVLGGAPRALVVALGVLLGIPLALAGLALAVAAGIVISFAQRAIAAEGTGPLGALRSGWRLLRAHPGTSLLVWLINVVLAIVAGIAIAVPVFVVVAVLAIAGVALWSAVGFTAPLVAYAALGGLAVLAAMLVLAAISNTFFWHYWTLAYLRLSGSEAQPASGA